MRPDVAHLEGWVVRYQFSFVVSRISTWTETYKTIIKTWVACYNVQETFWVALQALFHCFIEPKHP